ncbi:hypothetical protein DH2020_009880 [Rehmannia glutinosa]|uniref:WRKY domain-containing protein n=1 Tax=Rehmannia glutinosa TaxID=99300 RepID=A0ABR0X7I8_REHGL
MDDDDWDLHAVVRGCAAVTTTTSTAAAAATNNPFPPTTTFHDDQNSFDHFHDDPFQGLQEVYRELCVDESPPPAAADIPVAASTICNIPAAHVFQPRQEIVQVKSPPPLQINIVQNQENNNIQFNNPRFGSSSHNFPATNNPQPIRQRRRKNQQMKMVRQMTQEELSADSWAWRKYGQKPIKGSPYPRNYYRCSTSKAAPPENRWSAAQTIQRFLWYHTPANTLIHAQLTGAPSPEVPAPNFIFSTRKTATTTTITTFYLKKGLTISSSSTTSGSSFSPSTPLVEGEAPAENDDVEMAEEEDGGGDHEDDGNMFMNMMNDDEDNMFKGFDNHDNSDHDHSSGGGGGDLFSSGLLSSPPWTPTSSAGFNGGGGG